MNGLRQRDVFVLKHLSSSILVHANGFQDHDSFISMSGSFPISLLMGKYQLNFLMAKEVLPLLLVP